MNSLSRARSTTIGAVPLLILLVAGCAYAGPRANQDAGVEPLSDVFERIQNSVVVVRTSETLVVDSGPGAVRTSASGIGSGVMIDGEGRILTAAHVVQLADRVTVEFADGSERDARVVASEPSADLAMIQLEGPLPKSATFAPLGDSDRLRVGEGVFVVGAPLGVSHTLTVGHLSARRHASKLLRGERIELLQTDAAINQGNSGGPLFDRRGAVMGIVSHIISTTGGHEGLGFAVSVNLAKSLLLERPSFWSGLEGAEVTPELARALNVPPPGDGILVLRVARGSAGERLGLRGGTLPVQIAGEELLLGGDVVLTALGIRVAGEDAPDRIREAYIQLGEGAKFSVVILRQGVKVTLEGKRRIDPASKPQPASGRP